MGQLRRGTTGVRAIHGCREVTRLPLTLQSRGCWRNLRAYRGGYTCRLRDGQGTATVVLAASGRSVELGIVGSTTVDRLPHAAGVRRLGGDRQSHWDEHANEQQNQQ